MFLIMKDLIYTSSLYETIYDIVEMKWNAEYIA